ncbi:vacuolar ATP synthase subunit E [Neocallimastix lanati (nom. inval.)]|jgi:V-type H+-transporting ATPase subunit E|uniref:Vacuolar ATP synthase subunit E n=1 Tax=Neocallimastix californiae TaxID=1754190 RepID=A0A1Y2FH93_9FUNG|nr:vacuolar ATP synthase subunit E [Neocallimastix sp. JGI-2020a]ORY82175.1 vacuolar ATP synthase subunit E [Neocallimastix californiae]|eukprot:ORY82175.1 vacuolar ATP synthase subunit E [Neocallimastix californiae]
MATKGALNDTQVKDEMEKMVSFIKQEAQEKAREIKIKADEEFNIEKAKIVRQETIAIEAFYQKKAKQAEIQKKIAESNRNNKTRLQVLQARQQYLNKINDEALKSLVDFSNNDPKYYDTLKNIVLQSFYQLMEEDITITCREKDVNAVKKAVDEVAPIYKEKTGKVATVKYSPNYLPATSAGGIIMAGFGDRIVINNTLENRLEIASDELLPAIKIMLYGASESRKFYN